MTENEQEFIEIYGAREHNLKNLDVKIPRDQMVVITGLSGSGKSSLAFDTIYAEGQRRYIETFSAYARQFLGSMERPDVDEILGLSPVISIEQKTVNKSPRSTVGTVTEIYDFMRLLFARAADAFSYESGNQMVKYSDEEIADLILETYSGKKIILLAPKIKGRKGHYRELFEQIRKLGYTKVRVDGELQDITPVMRLDRYKIHDIEIVIDRLKSEPEQKKRILQSIETAMKMGDKSMLVMDYETGATRYFSRNLMCPDTGISYPEPEPNLFSFNSPYGACPKCNGLGEIGVADDHLFEINPKKSIWKGGIPALESIKGNDEFIRRTEAFIKHSGVKINSPLKDYPKSLIELLKNGTEEIIEYTDDIGMVREFQFEGIKNFIEEMAKNAPNRFVERWAQSNLRKVDCPGCNGTRLKKEALHFKIAKKNIGELAALDISELADWFKDIESKLTSKQKKIGTEIIKEIRTRLSFLLDVGLDYLSISRSSKSLSGGEAQRIRLATQVGTELVNVLYILDEPSIGLHQRDNTRLINSLKQLRDNGNSIIVVEHDKEMIESADFVLDIGPGAGINGGRIVTQGKPSELLSGNSITAQYLKGEKSIEVPKTRRKGNGKKLVLKKAEGHNLKGIDLKIPLGKMVCVTGVSGSGKSSLINQTLYPALSQYFYKSLKNPLPYKSITGLEHIDKVIEIDQQPIGRTPRSNPATYTGVFTEIRQLFTNLPESKIRGYKQGRFSFNVKGGRCETCQGGGLKLIEMNFLPDIYVECDECGGKRYNRETLEVKYKGKSINDVLEMNISQAMEFFEKIPKIRNIFEVLDSVGMGYVKVGQPSTTLSGGEAQRIKLASELSKKSTGKTLYILDEPSTGLHFEDIRLLIDVLNRLVNEGNTVVVIEHNLDIIKVADHIIDVGPEGGRTGGNIVCEGSPEKVSKENSSFTAKYLKKELNT